MFLIMYLNDNNLKNNNNNTQAITGALPFQNVHILVSKVYILISKWYISKPF